MASGSILTRFDAVPPTATISAGDASGASRSASTAAARIAATSVWVGGSCVTNRSVSRADPSWRPTARGRRVGVDDAEFRTAAADVDDERLVCDRHPLGHADDREEGLLLV